MYIITRYIVSIGIDYVVRDPWSCCVWNPGDTRRKILITWPFCQRLFIFFLPMISLGLNCATTFHCYPGLSVPLLLLGDELFKQRTDVVFAVSFVHWLCWHCQRGFLYKRVSVWLYMFVVCVLICTELCVLRNIIAGLSFRKRAMEAYYAIISLTILLFDRSTVKRYFRMQFSLSERKTTYLYVIIFARSYLEIIVPLFASVSFS